MMPDKSMPLFLARIKPLKKRVQTGTETGTASHAHENKMEADEEKLLTLLADYRAAMRQAVINAGGIAEPGVSDGFLLKMVPAKMLALRRLHVDYRNAMLQIMADMEGSPIRPSVRDAVLIEYASTGFQTRLTAIIERRDGEGQYQ